LGRSHAYQEAISLVQAYNRSAAVKAWLARDSCRIRLVCLPACAPNLNLIERLWWLLKKTTLWNEHYPTFAAFRAAISGFFDQLDAYRDQLASLTTDKFRFIGVSNAQVLAAWEYIRCLVTPETNV
jgi:uncharacterized membrane protein